jgi:hypothetical protein
VWRSELFIFNAVGVTKGAIMAIPRQKPPLGLTPRKFHSEERLRDVQGAIARYYDAELKIPIEWIEEYNELIEAIKK